MYLKIPYLAYSLLFGIFFGWLVSELVSYIYADAKKLPVVSVNSQKAVVYSGEMLRKLINDNIFNLELLSAQAVETDNGDGTATAPELVNAKLVGIVSTDTGRGVALILVDGNTIALSIGREKEGLKLVSLGIDEAEVERGGRKYLLKLEKGKSVLSSGSGSRSGKKSTNTAAAAAGSLNISIPRAEIVNELKDLNKVLQSALVSPAYNGKEFLGYKISRMKEGSPLATLGLQLGDVITRINGESLQSPEVLFQMLSNLEDISAVSIDIMRSGTKNTLFVEII